MTQPTFYKLTEEDLAIAFTLHASELKVWLWLCVKLPFGDSRTKVDTAHIAEETGVSRRSVQRAMNKFHESDLFSVEWTQAWVSRHPCRQTSPMSPNVTHVVEASPMSSERHPCRENVTHVVETSPMSRSQAETQAGQGFQNLQTIQTNQTLQTLPDRSEEEEKINNQNSNAPDSEYHSLAKSSGSLQRIDFSGAALNFNSANELHWALDWFGEERTPWLCEPKSRRNNIVFDRRFMEWHGQRWLEKFKKADLYEASADFRSSLLNNPDKIAGRWQEYEASIKHYAGATATAAINGAKIPEADQQHILRHQKALTTNTVEELDPRNAIEPEIEAKLLPQPQPAFAGDVGRILPAPNPVVEAAIASGELERDRFSSGYWWNRLGGKRCYFKNTEDWLEEIERVEVW